MKRFWFIVFAVGLCFATIAFAETAEQKSYIFAVVPQTSTIEIYHKWTPFVKKLEQQIGKPIQVRTYASIPEFEKDLLNGVPDFAYMNPYHLIMASKHGYIPLVKDKTPLVGILVVKKGGEIRSINDLNGKKIAFPAPNAFAASLYMRAILSEEKKVKFTPEYMKNHKNVYRAVIAGAVSAGGGVQGTLNQESDRLKEEMEIIYKTPGSASHPIAAHPRLPENIRKQVAETVLAMTKNEREREILKNIQMPNPVPANYEKDYLPLKHLGLTKYLVLEE